VAGKSAPRKGLQLPLKILCVVVNLVLETDAQQVIWVLKGDDYISLVGDLVHELKEMLAENFASTQVQYAPEIAIV
jgi:hypothetical protein